MIREAQPVPSGHFVAWRGGEPAGSPDALGHLWLLHSLQICLGKGTLSNTECSRPHPCPLPAPPQHWESPTAAHWGQVCCCSLCRLLPGNIVNVGSCTQAHPPAPSPSRAGDKRQPGLRRADHKLSWHLSLLLSTAAELWEDGPSCCPCSAVSWEQALL